MRKYAALLTFLFLITSIISVSQNVEGQKPEKNVPSVVFAAFNNQFPSQEPVWFSDYQGRYNQQLVYEARFILDKRYSSAVYDKAGGFVALASNVDHKELPLKIREYMTDNFPNFPLMDSILVILRNQEKTYELGIIIDGEYIIKVFSETGEFIKSTRA